LTDNDPPVYETISRYKVTNNSSKEESGVEFGLNVGFEPPSLKGTPVISNEATA
jgi:hypothetical protein